MAADPAILSPVSTPSGPSGDSGSGRLRQFLKWWRSELLAALPQVWRERLSGAVSGAPVVLLPDAVLTLGMVNGRLREVARLPLGGLEVPARAEAFQRVVRESGGRVDGAVLALPAEQFVARVVELPRAAEEAVQQVIGFELDRHTPFKASQARHSAIVLGEARDGAHIRVQLVAAPRSGVDELLQRASQLGVRPAALLPWDPESDLPSRQFNLLPEEARDAAGLPADLKLGLVLGAVFLVLFLASLVLPLWQKREAVIALKPRLAAAKAESDKVQATRTELERLVGDANFIQGKKHAQVPVTLLIEDLSRILPDTTWVAALEVKSGKQRELILTGETASATKVLELLEQVPYLKNPTFRSPLTKVPGQTTEKFVIAAEIKPRALPPAVEDPLPGTPAPPAQAAPGSAPPASPPAVPAPPAASAQPPAPAAPAKDAAPPKGPAPVPAKVEPPRPAAPAAGTPAPSQEAAKPAAPKPAVPLVPGPAPGPVEPHKVKP